MRLWKLFKITPLALVLAACVPLDSSSQTLEPPTLVAQAPSGSLPGARCPSGVRCGAQENVVVVVFPTSDRTARGTPWRTMHENGNRATPAANYRALGFSPRERVKIQRMRDSGRCVAMDMPNGIVADAMSFNDPVTGQLVVQYDVLVDLQNPITRATLVCEVNPGDYLVHALGCNNYLRIKGRPRPPPAPMPVAVAPQQVAATGEFCGEGRNPAEFRLCFQIFEPVGAANNLKCGVQDSFQVPNPTLLRNTVPLNGQRRLMNVVLTGVSSSARIPPSIRTTSGPVSFQVLNPNAPGEKVVRGVLPLVAAGTVFVPSDWGGPNTRMIAWVDDDPAMMNGYPQRCDRREDGFGDKNTGAMRTQGDRYDDLGKLMILNREGRLPSGRNNRLIFSYRVAG